MLTPRNLSSCNRTVSTKKEKQQRSSYVLYWRRRVILEGYHTHSNIGELHFSEYQHWLVVYSILEDVCYSAVAYDYYMHCSGGLTVVLCVSESCCCGKLCGVLPSRRRIVVEGSSRCQLPQNCTPITAAGQDVLRGQGRGGEGTYTVIQYVQKWLKGKANLWTPV